MGKNNALSRFLRYFITILLLALLSYFTYSFYLSIAYPLQFKSLIKRYARLNKVDPYLLCAIIREESRFDPEVMSEKGAVGLMQIMPRTADWVSKKAEYRLRDGDLQQPEINIKFGSWYYSYLERKYKNQKLALAAYNGGTANVNRWIRKHGIDKTKESIPFQETKNFVSRVISTAGIYQRLYPETF